MMVDSAVYVNGRSSEELVPVAEENGLHLLAVEGAIEAPQHPKPEHHVVTQFPTLESYLAARAP